MTATMPFHLRLPFHLGCIALVPVLLSCAEPATPAISPAEQPVDSNQESSRDSSSVASLEPPVLGELDIPGYESAIVSVPNDLSRPLPVLIATHGAGDGPEWHCAFWSTIVQNRGFVLCPRGQRISRVQEFGYYYPDHFKLREEVLAGLRALKTAGPEAIDPGPVIYAGYSQGATMGALMAVLEAETFRRLVLIEGGYNQWNLASARRYKRGGGERVLFACGVKGCSRGAQKSAESLQRAQIETRIEYAPGAGHTPAGPVAERIQQQFPWLISGDARWQ
jgi:predicted esterase